MTLSSSSARHLLVRLADARLPDALLGALRDEVVLAGWVRASGVLADVQLRAYDAQRGALSAPRRIDGPVQALVVDGSIGLANGDVTCGLRVVLARETEAGLETLAGELESARVVALEAMVTALDDVAAARSLDRSGVWLLDGSGSAAPRPAATAAPAAPSQVPAGPQAPAPSHTPAASPWADAARASDEAPAPKPAAPKPSPTYTSAPIPPRPVKPAAAVEEQIYPDAGDTAEHFAFGRCEVVKSDGDRLHVRLGKDGRIKEIALDMLKVTLLPPAEGQATRHFKLDRKL